MAVTQESFERYSVGQSVTRTEDPRLLTGRGEFTDDLHFERMVYAYVLRSPYAHAKINAVDVEATLQQDGVLDVILWEDMERLGIGELPCTNPTKNRDGTDMIKPRRTSLANDCVRYVGEPVALVVARSLAIARDAAELIVLDVEELASVTSLISAMDDAAPQLHQQAVNNIALDWEFGDERAVQGAFASAAHVTKLKLTSNRVVINPMEPRAAVAEFSEGRHVLHVGSQGVFGLRNMLANNVMKVPTEQLRVRTYDVGGSFGMKSAAYPEYGPLMLAAQRLFRPVKWCDERSDSFVSDQHGRDSVADVELALDEAGGILAARVHCYCNNGAYLSPGGPSMHTRNIPRNFPGGYRLPMMYARTRAMFTNTSPIGAYRGAGRPEGVYYMERLLDQAADELGMGRIEIRQKNLISQAEIPFTAVSELTYDSGDFLGVLAAGVEHSDWAGFKARRQASAARGRLRGLGLASYLEATGAPAREMGGIRFEDDGSVTMVSGSMNYGQGHASTFAQIVSAELGIPFDKLKLLQGDSDELIAGAGTGGSRTVLSAGTLLVKASGAVVEAGKSAAGFLFEADPSDIEFDHGLFRVAGTDRCIDIMDLAAQIGALDTLPEGVPTSLNVALADQSPPSAFPNGCHVAEVEIDPETGVVEVVRYYVVDDFGTLINPMLVEGQVQGGVAQGLGQALLEHTVYGEDSQLITGSFLDYTMPRASDIPTIEFASHPVPALTNPLGAKGCGEAGTTGSLPAIMNAVVDVLRRERGIESFEMPATPERVWAVLNARH